MFNFHSRSAKKKNARKTNRWTKRFGAATNPLLNAHLAVESLEERRMLAITATVTANILTIQDTGTGNTIAVTNNAGNVQVNGTTATNGTGATTTITGITINDIGGDTVNLTGVTSAVFTALTGSIADTSSAGGDGFNFPASALPDAFSITAPGTSTLSTAVSVASISTGSGTTMISGNVTTTAALGQTYNGPVTLTGAATLGASANGPVDFTSTVNGGFALTVNTAGTTTFGGIVGATTPLTSVTTDAPGSTNIGNSVTTTGSQTYNDSVALQGSAVIDFTAGNTSTSSSVAFNGAVSAASGATPTIIGKGNASPGPVTFTVNGEGAAVSQSGSTVTVAGEPVFTYQTVQLVNITNALSVSVAGALATSNTLTLSRVSNTTDAYTLNSGTSVDFNFGAAIAFNTTGDGNNQTLDVTRGASGDPVSTSAGATFTGGAGTGNVLNISGGTVTNLVYNATGAGAGNVSLDSATTTFTGLAPVTVTSTPTNVSINVTDTVSHKIALGAVTPVAVPGESEVSIDGGFESMTFTNPTSSLSLTGTGHADTLTLNPLGSGFSAGTITLTDGSGAEADVLATPATSTTNVDTNVSTLTSPFVVVVGGTFAAFNPTPPTAATNSLANISSSGNVVFTDSATAGVGKLYVDDSADSAAKTFGVTSTVVSPSGTGTITYNGAQTSVIQVAGGTGGNTFTVTSTSGNTGATTTLLGGYGAGTKTNTYNVTGTGLGASTVLSGEGIASTYNLNLSSAATIPSTASLTVTGHSATGFTGASGNRDTLAIAALGGGRTVGFNYQSGSSASSIQVTGLGGSSPIAATNIQQVNYGNGGANTGNLTVTGPTTASDITVAPQTANSALVFLGATGTGAGAGWAGPPGSYTGTLPGIAGGSKAPDLFLSGAAPAGLTIVGGSTATPGGDQLTVYAPSETQVVDSSITAGSATPSPFGFAGVPAVSGVIVPGHTVGTVYNTVAASDTAVTISDSSLGALLPVNISSPTPFAQAAPTVTPGLIVDSGDQAGSQVSGIADNITATFSANFKIQVNGGSPTAIANSTNGDKLTLATAAGQPINVWNDGSNPPNVTINTPATPDGIGYSSIENLSLTPGNGVMNVYGNNNLPSNPQNDYVNVVGTAANAYQLQVGTSTAPLPAATTFLSAPISVTGVTTLNVYGGSSTSTPPFVDSDVNTLNITPWANNTPQGWGVQTYYNQGGATAGDLLIWNGIAGVSENITVQPSGPLAGQVFATNAASGNTPVAIVNYTANLGIIINGTTGNGETDTLSLDGTAPGNGSTSGTDTFLANLGAAGTAADPMVQVLDTGAAAPVQLYNVLAITLTNDTTAAVSNTFNTLNFNGLGGGDTIDIESFFQSGTFVPNGFPKINIDGGSLGASAATIELAQSPDAISSAGSGSIAFTAGSSNDAGTLTDLSAVTGSATNTVTFRRAKSVSIVGKTTDTADSLTVSGTGSGDSFVAGPTTVTAPLVYPLPPGSAPVALAPTAPSGSAQVDGYVPINFYAFGNGTATTNTVTLAGGNGNASFNITPLAGIGITANGGGLATSNTATVNGTTGADTINVTPALANTATPTTANTTTVAVNALGKVSLTDTANLAINGQGGGDALTVTTPASANVAYTPGAAIDAGTLAVSGLVPVTFSNLAATGKVAVVTTAGTATDTLTFNGTSGNDAFTTSTTAPGSITLNSQLPVSTAGVTNLILNGLGGIDTFNLNLAVPSLYANVLVNGVQAAGADVVNVNDATGGNTVAVNLQPSTVLGSLVPTITGLGTTTIGLAGGDAVNINDTVGTVDSLTVNGDNNSDALTYTPTGAVAGTIVSANSNSVYNFTKISGIVTLNGVAGGTTATTVNGTAGNDTITAQNGAVVAGDTQVVVNGLEPVEIANANAGSLNVNGGLGSNLLEVFSTFVPVTIPINYNGGTSGPNALILSSGGAAGLADTTDVYTPGPQLGAGNSTLTFGSGTESVNFTNLSPVFDLVPGPLTVVGNNAANAITYLEGFSNLANYTAGTPSPTWGQVSVDAQEPEEFINKTTLTILGQAANDQINLNNAANTPTGLVGITVGTTGPTASDVLTVNGTTGADAIDVTPTGAAGANITGAGATPITATNLSQLNVNGQGGGDTFAVTTPATANVTYTPGSMSDSGSVQVNSLVPISYNNLGTAAAGASVTIAAATGTADTLTVKGTIGNDTFAVAATTGTVTLNSQVPILTPGVSVLNLQGNGGVDTFNVNGLFPANYTSVLINAAGASGDDPLDVTGPATNVNFGVSLNNVTQTQTITGLGAPISVTGVGTVNIAGGGGANDTLAVTSNQTATLNYTPTGANAGTFTENAIFPLFNFTAITGNFTVAGLAGNNNSVTVNATSNNDTAVVDEVNRVVDVYNPALTPLLMKPVFLDPTGATIQALTVQGGLGSDSFLVVPAAQAGAGVVGATPFVLPNNLVVNIVGGPTGGSTDSLVVANSYTPGAGGTIGTTTQLPATVFAAVDRDTASSGVVRLFKTGPLTQFPDIDYENVGIVQPNVATTGLTSQELVLGPDANQPNNSINTATYLGSGSTINANNLTIFPSANNNSFIQADQSYFRVLAQQTGTMSFQINFTEQTGFLPNNGELQILVYDANGNQISSSFGAGNTTGHVNLANSNGQRVNIPVVAGETYYLRVFGLANNGTLDTYDPTSLTLNGYSLTITNTPAPVPYDLQLNTVVAQGSVNAAPAPTTTSFSATSLPNTATTSYVPLSTTNNFYNGEYLTFADTTTDGSVLSETALITGYVGATHTFTLAAPVATTPGIGLTYVPPTGAKFQIESSDTGRSQLDSDTRINTPTIYINLADSNLLNDLTGGGTSSNTPPIGAIPITYATSTSNTPPIPTPPQGYRIAVFDDSDSLNPVLMGYAVPVAGLQSVYSYTFTTPLTDGVHYITTEVQMLSQTQTSTPALANLGFGGTSSAFVVDVDTQTPLVYFGTSTNGFDGLTPGSETGPPGSGITTKAVPTFFGTAEADAIVNVYAVVTNPALIATGVTTVLLGQTQAQPTDGTNQDPTGTWTLTSDLNLNTATYISPTLGLVNIFSMVGGNRTIEVTATDPAGNISPVGTDQTLTLMLPTPPQISSIYIPSAPTFPLFSPKPEAPTPTPLTTQLAIQVTSYLPAGTIAQGTVNAGATATTVSATSLGGAVTPLSTVNGFYVGEYMTLLNPADPTTYNETAKITGYVGATHTFTLAAPSGNLGFTAAPAAGDQFEVQTAPPPVTPTFYTTGQGTVNAGATTTALNVTSPAFPGTPLSSTANFYNGQYLLLLNPADPATYNKMAKITSYTPTATGGTFTLATGLTAAPLAGDLFKIEAQAPPGYLALLTSTAQDVSNYSLVGKSLGPITIESATVTNLGLDAMGNPTATVTLSFAAPLRNDIYTLTVSDVLTDNAGNALLGDVTQTNPDGSPIFPTGIATPPNSLLAPPSNFVGTFMVDTDAAVGTYADASADLNLVGSGATPFTLAIPGNLADSMGIHDGLFEGNFFDPITGTANGYDKLAAYGYDSNLGSFRWLIDTDGTGTMGNAAVNGISSTGGVFSVQPSNAQLNALPIAGNFSGNAANGDELGLFTGTQFLLDLQPIGTAAGDIVDPALGAADVEVVNLPASMRGTPVVGDFLGNGIPDLATYLNGTFNILIGQHSAGPGSPIIYPTAPIQVSFAFPGEAAIPVAGDMYGDGIDELGLWVPSALGNQATGGQFYFVSSINPATYAPGTGITPAQLSQTFTPSPLGNDMYIQYGTDAALPIVGIWDPPFSTTGNTTTGASEVPAATNLGVVEKPLVTSSQDQSGPTWLSTTPARNGNLEVSTGAANGGTVEASLYDSNYNLLATGTVDGNGNLTFSTTATVGHTYLIRLTGLAAGTAGSVTISNVVPEVQLLNVTQQGNTVTPQDALAVIDYLNLHGSTTLNLTPANLAANASLINLDTNMDGVIDPGDALAIIDYLNTNPVAPAVTAQAVEPQAVAPQTTASTASPSETVATPQVAAALDAASGSSAAAVASVSPAAITVAVTPAVTSAATLPASAVNAALVAAFQQPASAGTVAAIAAPPTASSVTKASNVNTTGSAADGNGSAVDAVLGASSDWLY